MNNPMTYLLDDETMTILLESRREIERLKWKISIAVVELQRASYLLKKSYSPLLADAIEMDEVIKLIEESKEEA